LTTPPRRPSSASRATRRSRRPTAGSGSFVQRNRSRIIWILGLAGFLVLATAFYANASRPTYACTDVFSPTPAPSWVPPSDGPSKSPRPATPGPATPKPLPTATPVPSGSTSPSGSPTASAGTKPTTPPTAAPVTAPPPGYVQPDQGAGHVDAGTTVTYPNCPPASGKHYNAPNVGPVRPGFYGLNDAANPPGWIHNLEHGAVVLLYSCTTPGSDQLAEACTDAGQQAMRDLFGRWPNSPYCDIAAGTTPGVVIARYDDMPWPYAAIVWDVVLPLQTLDDQAIFDFQAQRAERYNPEPLCPDPTPTAGPATPTPAVTAAPSGAPSPAASPGSSPAGSPAASPAASAPAAT
jgi:hypothetical protein